MLRVLIILISFLLMVCPCYSWTLMMGGSADEEGCDVCSTDDLLLSMHFENNLDITQGDPCGCTVGTDTTLTNYGSSFSSATAAEGTYSITATGASDYYEKDIATNEFDENEGKIVFFVYVDTWVTSAIVFRIDDGSATNRIAFDLRGGSTLIDIRARWIGAGLSDYIVCNSDKAEDEWLRVTYKFKENETAADHELEVCNWNEVTQSASSCVTQLAATEGDDLEPMTAELDVLLVPVGIAGVSVLVDTVKIYKGSGL